MLITRWAGALRVTVAFRSSLIAMLADIEALTNEKHTAILSSKFLFKALLGRCRELFMCKKITAWRNANQQIH
jgi:hypothetical protein